MKRRVCMAVVSLAAWAAGSQTLAQEQRFEIGARYLVVTAGGEPTNDQMGPGLFGRYRLNERWLVGAAIDWMSGDFERPYEQLGKQSPEEVDATVDSTIVSGWIEREYGRERTLRWFWSAGLGFSSPDVTEVTGPLVGGGTFDIATDAGSETLLALGGGLRWHLGQRFALELGARGDRHFADWELTDRSDGTTGAIDDYSTWGLGLGLRIAF